MPRAWRSNTAKPSAASTPCTARTAADCDTCSNSAAPVVLPATATACTMRSFLSSGARLIDACARPKR